MHMHSDHHHRDARSFAATLSLVVGTLLMLAKFYAHARTGSALVYSDAMESVVNVVAAFFAMYAVRFAEAPPDRDHPYGHGKIEFVSAAFEGGLITIAALLIGVESVEALYRGPELRELNFATGIILGAGIANGLLGVYLIRTGRATNSLALEADGKHVLTDFYTSLALVVGLLIVQFTGLLWLDATIGLVMASFLGFSGVKVLRQSLSGILDAEDPELLERIRRTLEEKRKPGIIRFHHVRAMRVGRRIHVDGHVVVPEFWSVEKAHDVVETFEKEVVPLAIPGGEIEFHVDPCKLAYCSRCDLSDCSVRRVECKSRPEMSLSEMVDPKPRMDEV